MQEVLFINYFFIRVRRSFVKGTIISNINHPVIIPANPNHLKILVLITKSTIKISIVVILPSKIALRLLS